MNDIWLAIRGREPTLKFPDILDTVDVDAHSVVQSVVVFANTWARVAGFPDSRCIVWVVVVLVVWWV